jgi:hypothetical protein
MRRRGSRIEGKKVDSVARLERGEERGVVRLVEGHRVVSFGAFGQEHTEDRPVAHLRGGPPGHLNPHHSMGRQHTMRRSETQ